MKIERTDSPEEVTVIRATAEDVGKRLDQFVALQAEMTRSAVARLIDGGDILVNQKAEGKNYRLRAEDEIEISLPAPEISEILPQNIPLDVVYEDEDLIVINKPVGMVVHPAPGNPDGTLVNALLYHCGSSLSGIGGVIRPGIVHRIDKETSGLLVVAKNDEAHLFLAEQLKGHRINRIYQAIAVGNFKEERGTIDAPIGRHPVDRKKMAVIRNPDLTSREAVTHWQVLGRAEAEGNCFTLLRCELETGRTHQIRVHCASVGHPLLGDPLYGGNGTRFEAKHRALITGQCLHAGEISFVHPRTKENMTFTCPLPEDLARVKELLFGAEK